MKIINSLSGGKTSSFMAVHYPADYNLFSVVCIDDIKCKPKDTALRLYASHKLGFNFIATAEDDKTLIAMMDLEQYIGKEIIWVRGMSYDDVIDKGTQTRLPSWARRYCTEKMKLLPIFLWWFTNIGEKCKMQIGFRYDEFDRMEKFLNNSDPTNFKIAVNCSTLGLKRQTHKTFNWRYCHFPLVKNGIQKRHIDEYWKNNGYIGGNLFEERKKIFFPAVSNCVGCFHKSKETLAAMCIMHPEKMQWFAEQEKKNMGTWLDDKTTYEYIYNKSRNLSKEVIHEISILNESCESEGCTN
jgi:hypothetical protein